MRPRTRRLCFFHRPKSPWEARSNARRIAPFAPHFSEELWNMFGNKKSIHLESWPEYNSELIEEGDYDLIIQVNGKSRDRIRISKGLERSEIEKIVLTRDIVRKYTNFTFVHP